MATGKIFCLVGGSGSGKDTLKNNLGVPHVVSYRTRAPRPGEQDGVDGFFVDEKTYQLHKATHQVAGETVYNGNRYWTTYENFRPYFKGLPMLYVVDWEGVRTLRTVLPPGDVIAIWIDVPNMILRERMEARGDTKEQIAARMLVYNEKHFKEKLHCDYSVDNSKPLREVVGTLSDLILWTTYGKSGEGRQAVRTEGYDGTTGQVR